MDSGHPAADSSNPEFNAIRIDEVQSIAVGPGCYRRDLRGVPGVRLWVVDMDPGSTWPHVDHHDGGGEAYLVLSGEIIEGENRFGEGAYVVFNPESSHQPRTEKGVRLFGLNPASIP
jgi:anti-sigma factor ChrR (cupin superfamily)